MSAELTGVESKLTLSGDLGLLTLGLCLTGEESTLSLSGEPGALLLGLLLKGAASTVVLSADAGTFQSGQFFNGAESTITLSAEAGTLHTQYGWAGAESTLTISPDAGLLTLGLELTGAASKITLSGDAGTLTTIAPPQYALTNLSLTRRPGALSFDGMTSFDLGPVDFLDLREGLFYRPWYAQCRDKTVYMARANAANTDWQDEFALFSYTGTQGYEFDLTFDQNGRAAVSFHQDGMVQLYWYDPIIGSMVIAEVCEGRNAQVMLDLRNQMLSAMSDVILMYISETNGRLEFRLQRDRFDTVYPTGMTDIEDCYLQETGLAKNWRFYAWMVRKITGGYEADSWHSDIYPYPAEAQMEFEVDAILSAAIRQAIEAASAQDVDMEFAVDQIISAATRDVMKTYELGDSETEMEFEVDAIVSAIIREAIIVRDQSGYPAEMSFSVDEITAAAIREAILARTMQDASMEFGVDQILSASIA